MPRDLKIRKVCVIGSGPIVIGQAAEFDYAGTQACRVLKSEGIEVTLINSNPATIMTDAAMADEIYLEPLTETTVRRILEKERPDGLLAALGGQTGLTLAMKLSRDGTLARLSVRLLGTDASAITKAEDRELFKEAMEKIGQPVIPSGIAGTEKEALAVADSIGYPVIVRPAFTLGGAGGGVAEDEKTLSQVAKNGLAASPITQILVEKYVYGWKEIEFETVRDGAGNKIAVCSMENVDPVGVHTGDSVVVAPALTLSDKEYQMLRSAALDIVEALDIRGACNCQFALNPSSFEYAVIEVNPRVSRSSALASKATGYPIAKVAAKIALGYRLDEIISDVTGKTAACFEPAIDYVVVKFPKWPFDKFAGASRKLGTQMKATGEVMAIAPSFEAALMKAVRGAEISLDTLNMPGASDIAAMDDKRLFAAFAALKAGESVDKIAAVTRIDPFFLHKIKNLADYENRIAGGLSDEDYFIGKRLGYPDAALSRLSGRRDLPAFSPVYKMVDTCAAEFEAETPYFYASCGGECESAAHPRSGKPVALVLGSGPIRIGQGIEFDYSSVHCVWALQKAGYEAVIVNNNPETVSTDYDTADRLYFEPLTFEDVMGVINVEKPVGAVVAFGGQTAIKLTKALDARGVRILGTSAEGIDIAEDRERFDQLLSKFSIKRPRGMGVRDMQEALCAAESLGYPVLLRPSYVIGGQNMVIAHAREDVSRYMARILSQGIENPVLVDKYMPGIELEADVISDGEDVLIPGIMEHIERAGVHSGDSIAVYPPYNLPDHMRDKVCESSRRLALSLGTKGLVNIQYLIHGGELYVIEVNPRASRTVPYISKVTGVPMVDIASRVMLGEKLKDIGCGTGLCAAPPYFTAKAPVFSFEKLFGANAYLGPEMKSTGEVLGVGKTLPEALFKALTASGLRVRTRELGVFLSVDDHDYQDAVGLAKKLNDIGARIYATLGTAQAVSTLGIPVEKVRGIKESDNAFKLLESGRIGLVVYTGAMLDDTVDDYIALHRRTLQLGIPCLTSLDTAGALLDILASGFTEENTELVDAAHLRKTPQRFRFAKLQASGNDYILIDGREGGLPCPESLCLTLCDRSRGVGGCGIILLENSTVADIRMRVFNRDGSEGMASGSALFCAGKYLRDRGIIRRELMTVETAGGARGLKLYLTNGRVSSVCADMGEPRFLPADIPVSIDAPRAVDYPAVVAGELTNITCLSLGNPHCVILADAVDAMDVPAEGRRVERDPLFPKRVNVEFMRVVNPSTLRLRVWERGNGETPACGTGACAAAVAACEMGYCRRNEDITVKTNGGDLIVRVGDAGVSLTGPVALVYEGEAEY